MSAWEFAIWVAAGLAFGMLVAVIIEIARNGWRDKVSDMAMIGITVVALVGTVACALVLRSAS